MACQERCTLNIISITLTVVILLSCFFFFRIKYVRRRKERHSVVHVDDVTTASPAAKDESKSLLAKPRDSKFTRKTSKSSNYSTVSLPVRNPSEAAQHVVYVSNTRSMAESYPTGPGSHHNQVPHGLRGSSPRPQGGSVRSAKGRNSTSSIVSPLQAHGYNPAVPKYGKGNPPGAKSKRVDYGYGHNGGSGSYFKEKEAALINSWHDGVKRQTRESDCSYGRLQNSNCPVAKPGNIGGAHVPVSHQVSNPSTNSSKTAAPKTIYAKKDRHTSTPASGSAVADSKPVPRFAKRTLKATQSLHGSIHMSSHRHASRRGSNDSNKAKVDDPLVSQGYTNPWDASRFDKEGRRIMTDYDS